jgi:hypothetical protein
MPPRRGLPTRAEFFSKNLDVLEKCDICHDPFNATHTPARINSRKCKHTFGVTCLRKWAESGHEKAHTCPLCREVLFHKPKTPKFKSGARATPTGFNWMHQIDDRVLAEKFVKTIWYRLWTLFTYHFVFDSDIEEQINAALFTTAENFNYPSGLFISAEHWPAVKKVGREMVQAHYENGVYLRCDDLRSKWMPKMQHALGWVLDAEMDMISSD